MKWTEFSIGIFISLMVLGAGGAMIAIGQLATEITKEDIDKTLSEQDNRKSFGYCPDSTILDKYGVSYTLESCPLSRLYIDDWDKISSEDRDIIYNELNANGWRIEDN